MVQNSVPASNIYHEIFVIYNNIGVFLEVQALFHMWSLCWEDNGYDIFYLELYSSLYSLYLFSEVFHIKETWCNKFIFQPL